MAGLADGARQLPLRHISIRVPWNDTGWEGVVCRRPQENISCLILPRVRDTKDDKKEIALAGRPWNELESSQLPPCFIERGQFMAPFEMTRLASHPYSGRSDPHNHFAPTRFRLPPYSAACIPFNWMLKESAYERAEKLELGFNMELEDNAHQMMRFDTHWIQTKHNQNILLDTFFSAIRPDHSLCFFYAKRMPLVEDSKRVIIGVGLVKHVGLSVEYEYSGPGPLQGVLWERNLQHSVRPGFQEGFILPYHQLQEYLDNHQEEDPSDYVAFVPDEQFWSFSFASEHVTNDGAIASLLSCAKALENIKKVVPGPWEWVLKWVDGQLNRLWKMRGPFPGMGAALTAFGVENGSSVAYELEEIQAAREGENIDPWSLVDPLFSQPGSLKPELHAKIGDSLRKKWAALPDERRRLLKLLSRFELTNEQATRYYVHEDKSRENLRIRVTDDEILENPYLLYELDRIAPDPISLAVVDRGLFPDASLRERYPIPEPSRVDDATDSRRVRSFVIRQLELGALQGDTLLPRERVIREIRELDVQPSCPVDGDLMAVVEDSFEPSVHQLMLVDGERAYKLDRLQEVRNVISSAVYRRAKGKRHEGDIPWRERLDREFHGPAPKDDREEQAARTEKAAALKELYAARLSVLVGPAGTGKTTLLKVLCEEPTIKEAGVLLLAPTGKARVRMQDMIGISGAQTIAQFLMPLDRYDPDTATYRLSDREKVDAGKTVIIDESSMLTEEQLAAVLDAVKGVQRFILVGDQRQLPPIGAGRPFLDIVRQVTPGNIEAMFPRVGLGYTELTVRRRQKAKEGEERDDLLLAEWFSGRPLDPGADEIWNLIKQDVVSPHLKFVRWDHVDELDDLLLQVLVEELELDNLEDVAGFEQSYGGTIYEGNIYFQRTYGDIPGACAKVEDWQVLSPVRANPQGVESINRLIQTTFRSRTKQYATQPPYYRKIPKPMGPEGILYGDKVINTRNQRHYRVWPKEGALRYVANGEIGVVVGQFKTKKMKWIPNSLEVEFSSQPSFKYTYGGNHFADEAEPSLALAYALTVHKTQGSEFGLTLVVLPNPCRLTSRELLYTALTRQKDRVVILHQGDRHDLMKYSIDYYSESASRLTNLFQDPQPVPLQDRFLEDGLIHRTRRGDSVRSKSEVIIADLMFSKDIDYQYELRLVGNDGNSRYPDFTIEDDETGQIIYWEHLGMLRVPAYKERWERKEKWYREQGILPWNEGGGPGGILVVSCDDERGGINAGEIESMLAEVLGY
ncbi:MAG: AAA family ATPase [Anaerolineales bacterium]|nr:AAA family ATPase [Anaerolineales bacterium]